MNVCAANSSPHRPADSGKPSGSPREGRLLRHSDFERVYKQGQRHFAAHLTMFYLRRPAGEGLRVGFTVGRALGGAVERNRMKRRLREAVWRHRGSVAAAVDVVINPKKNLLHMDFAVLLVEVERGFRVIQQKLGAGNPETGAKRETRA